MVFGVIPRVGHGARPVQVRFFQEPGIAELEAAINEWLAGDARREIVDIRQSVVNGRNDQRELIVSIWYVAS
ncbi:MAG: hypothetical protein ACRELX_07790 [Longimicrobiales bacterium]